MVTRGTYFDDDEQIARRYSSRGHGYSLGLDRDLPPTPHHVPYTRHHVSSLNGNVQNNRQSPEQGTSSAPRRRIPVACGRCRKRKIRCSGDPGNGEPCDNCKTAGNEACQFLRVSSTEAQMKSEGAEYGYASAVSRIQCRMNPYGPQHQHYATSHATPLSPDLYPTYRHSSLSAYQPIKYYPVSSYSDFADESLDYGIHTSNYVMNQEGITIPYSTIGSTRVWSQPQLPKNNSLFVEQDSSYSHCQPPYSNNLPYRPNINSEAKSLSLLSMATALSPSVNSTDRVLPVPSPAYRTAQMAGPYRSAETSLPLSQMQYGTFNNNGMMNTNMMDAVKALTSNAASESSPMSSNYLPLSSSPPESVPSSQMSFGAQSVSSTNQQNHDGYTTSHESSQHSLYQQGNNSSGNLDSYGPSSGSNRPSISSPNGEDSQSISNHGYGSLVNGNCYIPPVSNQPSYPAPPMVPSEPPSQVITRQSVTAT